MAGLEAVAFGSIVLFHWAMGYGVSFIITDDYKYFHSLLNAVIVLVFGTIYMVIALDTLVIFVPVASSVTRYLDARPKNEPPEPVQGKLFQGAEPSD